MPEIKDTEKLSAKALKNALWKTLQDLRSGDIAPGTGDSVASQAREILRTSNTQLKILGQARVQVPTELIDFAQK